LNIFTSFLAGIGVSFTPCVYPLLPVTIGIIGNTCGNNKLKAFLGSLIYSLGIAFTYTVLGIIAALLGKIFGFVQTNPYVNLLVGVFLIVFSLSFLGMYQFPFINVIQNRTNPTSFFMLFFIGAISGLVISPCTSPALGSILIIAATKADVLKGGTLLFFFAIGMSFTLILAGTFSSLLPKKGKWLNITEKILGFILLFSGIYFVYNFWKLR